jgi:hypothetical protein
MGGKFELHHSRDGQSQSPQTMGPQGLGNPNAGSYKQAGPGMNHSFALNNFKNQPTNSGYPAH